jgi:hypothetical protein
MRVVASTLKKVRQRTVVSEYDPAAARRKTTPRAHPDKDGMFMSIRQRSYFPLPILATAS